MTQLKVLLGTVLIVLSLVVSAPSAIAQTEGKGYAMGDMVLGSEDAPVTIIEYASYTCPACANFHTTVFDDLREKYVETGKVRFIFREFIRNRLDLVAATLARCAGPEKFYGLAGMLFRQQATWMDAEDKLVSLQQLGRFGGISEERLDMCLNDEELGNQILETTQEAMQEHQINATPTFLVNGDKYTGALSLEEFDEVLAKYLK